MQSEYWQNIRYFAKTCIRNVNNVKRQVNRTNEVTNCATSSVGLINSANERQRVRHVSGAGRRGPRERACKGVRGTKSPG